MATFTDTKDRAWEIEISLGTCRRARRADAVGRLDLFTLVEDGCRPLAELGADPYRLVDLLWWLVRDQAGKHGVDAAGEDFGEALGGDALNAARVAFVEALIDFFPEPERRAALRAVQAKFQALFRATVEHGLRKLEALDVEAEAAAIFLSLSGPSTRLISGPPSTPSPASSGTATPTSTPSPSTP